MDNYVWNDFGVLASVSQTDSLVIVKNANGESRKMSLVKYKESALEVRDKALAMIGQSVVIRTSQNTHNWSVNEWFSEIALR